MALYLNSNSSPVDYGSCDSNESLSQDEAEGLRYSEGQVVLLVVILPIILILGITGNLTFIYVVIRIQHMQTITNRYLVSLAIADVVFLCSAVGHKLLKYAMSPIQGDDTALGTFGCVWIYFISDTTYFSSLLCVSLVTIDRFMAVCRPQNRKSLIKLKSMEIIVTSWVFSALLAACLTPGNVDHQVICMEWPDKEQYQSWPKAIRFCSPLNHQVWIGSLSTGLQTVPFFVTLAINFALYVSIIKGLDKCIRRLSKHGVQSNVDTGIRNQIAKMLVVNGVVFFCLLSPFEILSLFSMVASIRAGDYSPNYLISNETTRQYLLFISQLCSYINSTINPVVYTVMCRRYRQAFKKVFLPETCVNIKNHRFSNSCKTGDIHFDTVPQGGKDETAV